MQTKTNTPLQPRLAKFFGRPDVSETGLLQSFVAWTRDAWVDQTTSITAQVRTGHRGFDICRCSPGLREVGCLAGMEPNFEVGSTLCDEWTLDRSSQASCEKSRGLQRLTEVWM